MKILEQTTDMAGKIRMTCQTSTGESIFLKFSTQPSQEQLDEIEARHIEQHQNDDVQKETLSIEDHYDLIREFILLVKANPNVTYAQYTNYLNGKTWFDSAIIRFFVYKLATALAQKYNVTLSNYTEQVVLGKLRDWIVATPGKKIEKIVYGIS